MSTPTPIPASNTAATGTTNPGPVRATVPETTPEPVPEPAARFRDLLASEWIKLWSLRSTVWCFVLGALAITGFNASAAYDDQRRWASLAGEAPREGFRMFEAFRDAFTMTAAVSLILAACVIGAMTVVSEHGTGLIRTTFTAVPARRAVMTAKVVVVTGVMTVFGVLVAGASFWLSQAILSGEDAGVSIGDPGAPRVVAASALLAPVCALAGMALGTLLRHTAATMVAGFAVVLMLPLMVGDDRYWFSLVDHALPYSAWDRLVRVEYVPGLAYPWTVTGAWTVYAVWGIAAAAITVLVGNRRDL